jgi:hypothetical protein
MGVLQKFYAGKLFCAIRTDVQMCKNRGTCMGAAAEDVHVHMLDILETAWSLEREGGWAGNGAFTFFGLIPSVLRQPGSRFAAH